MELVNILITAETLFYESLIAAIFLQAILSFTPWSRSGKFAVLLRELSDPILVPLRSVIPPMGAFDFSPMIGMILIYFFGRFLVAITTALA